MEDFLHYSGHDFPSLSIAGIPTDQLETAALKKIIGDCFLLQTCFGLESKPAFRDSALSGPLVWTIIRTSDQKELEVKLLVGK